MITGFDSYKLSVNNLNSIYADTIDTSLISNNEINTLNNIDTSQTIQNQINNINTSISNLGNSVSSSTVTTTNLYTSYLYVNSVLINFSSYINSGYLNTALASYATLTDLSNYATLSYLNGYRSVADSWSRSDTTNEIVNRTGVYNNNPDGSIQTCKQYTDAATAGLSSGLATNIAATSALGVSLSGTQASLTATQGTVATQGGEIDELNSKTQFQTASLTNLSTTFTNTLNVTNGISNVVQLKNDGSIYGTSLNITNINPNSGTINIGGLTSTIYINGLPYTPFNVFSGFSQF
jgi:hypothetical protein